MPILIRTGKCPASSGRNTSALSLAPSRMATSTSFSTLILYLGSDALVSLRLATCSCTVASIALATDAIKPQGLRLQTPRPPPHHTQPQTPPPASTPTPPLPAPPPTPP